MTSTMRRGIWIAKILRRAASSALGLAVMLAPMIIATQSAYAQTFTVLHTFKGGMDGSMPHSGLVGDAAGNLYGTTKYGGTHGCLYGCGTIFQVSATGKERILHRFTGGQDGQWPSAGLVRDADGNLYGMTERGGDANLGTVFKLDAHGNETILHSFRGVDGAYPVAGLARPPAGNLYGTTPSGGASHSGLVFRLDAAGHETILYSFTGGEDGGVPNAGLIRDPAGNFYGTTTLGGILTCNGGGCGTVFMLDKTGKETVLYSFTGGWFPRAGLVRDSDGNLYGTTSSGGDHTCNPGVGCGTVFKLDTSGKQPVLAVLHSFTGPDGEFPASVVRDADGNLYGTAESGGDFTCFANGQFGCGTVFKLDTTGTLTVLQTFHDGEDGAFPEAGLVRDAAGNLYGTTLMGGHSTCFISYGCGVVFKITP